MSTNAAPLARIDGSLGEGGGQILRNAIAYACLLQKSVEIYNIRAGRSKPGLRPQHLTGIRLCRDIAGGTLIGEEVGSTTIRYDPDPPSTSSTCTDTNTDNNNKKKRMRSSDANASAGSEIILGDTKTAGSVCLLLQAALPCALFANRAESTDTADTIELELRGGTNATMAPQLDYLTNVFLPVAKAGFGLPVGIDIDVRRRGYFPRGGGVVRVSVPPLATKALSLKPISLVDRGDVVEVNVRAFHAGKCPRWVAQKMADAAVRDLRRALLSSTSSSSSSSDLLIPANVESSVEVVMESNALDSASGILIVARTDTGCYLAGSALGKPKVKPNKTGQEAAEELVQSLRAGGCVDGWLQDQLILYMALAGGEKSSEIIVGCLTLHTQTAIDIAQQMTGVKFEVIPLSEATRGGTSTNDGGDNSSIYGATGLVGGRHLIRCRGIAQGAKLAA